MAATDATKFLNKTEYTESLSRMRSYIDGVVPTKLSDLTDDIVTGHYLPLAGGTLSGNITAPKFVKSGGTSSQFLKADGSVDSNTYLTTGAASSTYVTALGVSGNNLTWTKNGTTNSITPPFATKARTSESGTYFDYGFAKSGKIFTPGSLHPLRLYSTQLNDAFYALNKRKTISFTGFQGTTAGNVAKLFNHVWDVGVFVKAGETGVMTIGSTEDTAFTTYTYGPIYLSFYVESTKGSPSSISIRAYGTKGGVVGWYDYSAVTHEKNNSGQDMGELFYASNSLIYNIKCWEITIVAHDTLPTYLAEIYAIFTRTNGEVDQSVVTKFANDQTLYGAITIDNTFSTTGKATLNSLEVTNASTLKGATAVSSTLSVSGATTLTGGATIKGTGNAVTNINGASASVDYSHIFVTGSSNNTRPLVLQNGYGNVGIGVTAPTQKLEVSGNITTSGYVAVGTGRSNGSYIGSDSATNIYLHNSAGYLLIADGLVVRRGVSVPTATLGSTTYRWGGVYSTAGNFSGNVDIGGNVHVAGDTVELDGQLAVTDEIFVTNGLYIDGHKFLTRQSGVNSFYWDSDNNAWRLSGNFIADGFISAGGASDSSGSGGIGIEDITTRQDGTVVFSLSDGNSYTIDLNHEHPQYPKYVLLADEAAYNALATKDSGTLYLIPETSSAS